MDKFSTLGDDVSMTGHTTGKIRECLVFQRIGKCWYWSRICDAICQKLYGYAGQAVGQANTETAKQPSRQQATANRLNAQKKSEENKMK